jgi:succinate dehydrogenase flavin-adding protein (antitoxin of CptAB toxin-antitoxin module)
MANMVYCYLEVTAPTKEKLEEFVENCTDSDLDSLLSRENIECKFYLTDKIGPYVNSYKIKDNTIVFDFDVKWSPPAKEIKAMTEKFWDFNFNLESWQEFHEFTFDMSSSPNHYTEKYKKLSSEEIDKIMDECYIDLNKLISDLASMSESRLEGILEQVAEARKDKKVLSEKYQFITDKIDSLNKSQINEIYKILNPTPSLSMQDVDDFWPDSVLS